MMTLLDPKNDIVFQKLFGIKENDQLLISFLNSILTKHNNGKITSVALEERVLTADLISSEKLSILDIRVTTDTNAHINIEIQLINQYNMIRRTMFYLSKMILKQLVKGDNYSELTKTITINILDFNYLDCEDFHSCYHYYEDTTQELLTDISEIHFIELPKFKKVKKDYTSKLHRWLSFLVNPRGEEIDMLKNDDTEIKEAMDVLYQISGDSDIVYLAELRDKAIRDEKSRLQGAHKEGVEVGKSELLIKQLKKKFPNISQQLTVKISKLSSETLDTIATEIFDINTLDELNKYLI